MSAAIRVRGLRKSFGDKRVLDGVDLEVAAGTSLVVIGGSGSGKSVLIKCILGLIEPDAGTIEISTARTWRSWSVPRERRCGRASACCSRTARCLTACRSGKT